jgi:hypothetical protein
VSATQQLPTEDQRKAEAFNRAVAYVADRYGQAATVEAFGDRATIDAMWELEDLDGFRSYLWWRCRAVRRGAA